MNISERLKEAYDNVSFSADSTWALYRHNPYHKSNLELSLTERHLKQLKTNRPRSVRECIPQSRLAIYGDYGYNESREMSYASTGPSNIYCGSSYSPIHLDDEQWECPEVEGLYGWYIADHTGLQLTDREHESPLLRAYGFEDRLIKVHLTESRLKRIWSNDRNDDDVHNTTLYNCDSCWEATLDLYMSPLRRFFALYPSINCDETNEKTEWFRSISVIKDLGQLQELSEFFQDENTTITKMWTMESQQEHNTSLAVVTVPPPEPVSTEILYSEVLQGLLPSKKLQSTNVNNRIEEQKSVARLHPEISVDDKSMKSSQLEPPIKASPASIDAAAAAHSNNRHTFSRWKLHNQRQPTTTSTTVIQPNNRLPFVPTAYVHHPTYFYSPTATAGLAVHQQQRWIAPNSQWYCQNQMDSYGFHPGTANNLRHALELTEFKGFYTNHTKSNRTDDFVDDSTATFNDEHQVSASLSEELEIQALEQYDSSNENFYQDLEQQAAEQYRSNPE